MNDSEKFRQTLDESMSEELEVIRGIADLRRGGTGASKASARVPLAETEPEAEDATVRRTPWQFIRDGFINMLPHKSDGTREIVRKCALIAAVLVIIGTVSYLIYDMAIIPAENANMNEHLSELYNPSVQLPDDDPSIDQTIEYPAGMHNSFKPLYAINKDIAGWITYEATGSQEFLDIDYPVVWSGDNDYYLYRNFYGNNNKNGTLYLDGSNTVDPYNRNKISVIYGHNMASGQMFAHLNTLLKGVYYARTSATFTYNTIYEENRYKVFALVLVDEDDREFYFDYRHAKAPVSSDADFMNYINELRARSWYDYPVDVIASDEIVVLSTCTNASQVKFGNGRLAVVARRVRPGESASVATGSIAVNEDAIKPLAWYNGQGLTPHRYYIDAGYQIPTITQTAGTTASTESTASGMTTAPSGSTSTSRTNVPQNTTRPVTPGTTAPTTPPVGPTVPTDPNAPTSSDGPSDTTDPNAPTSSDGPSDTTDPNAPTESQPTESEPTESEPTESQPTESEPTESEPTESEPTESEPTESQPTESQPTESEPTVTEPTENAPATEPVENGEAA